MSVGVQTKVPILEKATDWLQTLNKGLGFFRRKKSNSINHQILQQVQPASKQGDLKSETLNCQLVRSASSWSIGMAPDNTEFSIQIAYLKLIADAKHFIYIENQFFISALAGRPVKNQIAQALLQRIKRAAAEGQDFFVLIILPLLPGFEGEIDGSNSSVLKIQMNFQYRTISRGGTSLLEQLRADPNIENLSDYIQFIGLRNHAEFHQKPITEQVYVHSKVKSELWDRKNKKKYELFI